MLAQLKHITKHILTQSKCIYSSVATEKEWWNETEKGKKKCGKNNNNNKNKTDTRTGEFFFIKTQTFRAAAAAASESGWNVLMLVAIMFHVICGKACAWMFLRAIFGSFAVVHVHFFLFCFIFPHSLPFSLSLTVCFVSQFLFLSAKRCDCCCCCCFHRRLGLMWFALLFIMHFFYRNTIIRFFPLEWAEWILCYFVSLERKRERERVACKMQRTKNSFVQSVSR